jgi:hypothetical protein
MKDPSVMIHVINMNKFMETYPWTNHIQGTKHHVLHHASKEAAPRIVSRSKERSRRSDVRWKTCLRARCYYYPSLSIIVYWSRGQCSCLWNIA